MLKSRGLDLGAERGPLTPRDTCVRDLKRPIATNDHNLASIYEVSSLWFCVISGPSCKHRIEYVVHPN